MLTSTPESRWNQINPQMEISNQFNQAEKKLVEIDSLIDASTTTDSGLTAAAAQTSQGDISGAATTLERMLIINPDSVSVRISYVAALCQLDDQQAAKFETSKLEWQEISDEAWSGVQAACGAVAKPKK